MGGRLTGATETEEGVCGVGEGWWRCEEGLNVQIMGGSIAWFGYGDSRRRLDECFIFFPSRSLPSHIHRYIVNHGINIALTSGSTLYNFCMAALVGLAWWVLSSF